MEGYSKTFQVIWADIDANRHMRHTAYNDYAAQVRVSFFIEKGMPVEQMAELQIGPILFREETAFLREVGMNETIKADIWMRGMRKDGSRWKIIHNIYKSDNVHAAIITVEGAWIDLIRRKLIAPPEGILQMMNEMPRTPDFEIFPDKSAK